MVVKFGALNDKMELSILKVLPDLLIFFYFSYLLDFLDSQHLFYFTLNL